MPSYPEERRIAETSAFLARTAADAIEEGAERRIVLNNVFRLVSDWRSHEWFGMPEADRLRDAMGEAFPEGTDFTSFTNVLKASAGVETAGPVSKEERDVAVRRLRRLAEALS